MPALADDYGDLGTVATVMLAKFGCENFYSYVEDGDYQNPKKTSKTDGLWVISMLAPRLAWPFAVFFFGVLLVCMVVTTSILLVVSMSGDPLDQEYDPGESPTPQHPPTPGKPPAVLTATELL